MRITKFNNVNDKSINIPDDWKVKSLGDELDGLEAGISVNSTDEEIIDGDLCVLKSSAVFGGYFNPSECKKIALSDLERAKLNPQKDSIIISRMNTPLLVGECGYVEETYENLFLPDRLWQTKIASNSNVHPKWLNYLLNTDEYKLRIKGTATGTSNSMKNISKDAFLQLKIPLPPLHEQRAIAACLSTWDKAIAKTEALIAQKELQKKWLMQQLLTGKKRLKGFEGDWVEVRLGDLGDTYNGLTGKVKEDFGTGFPFITYMNVFSNSKIDLNQMGYVNLTENDNQNAVQYGDIFFTVSSETPNEVGMAAVLLDEVENVYLNSFCFGFRMFNFDRLNPEYAQYIMRFDSFRESITLLSQGSTRFNISKSGVCEIKMNIPAIIEQKAIVMVLQSADKEIQHLNKEKNWLIEQKKWLMQVLLIGKKRLA